MNVKTMIGSNGGLLLLVLLLATPVGAAMPAPAETPGSAELRALTQSIDNLARQLQEQAGRSQQDMTMRKLDIAIAYLNFRSRRIEMFERELQSVRSGRNRLEDVLEQFQREAESLPQTFDSSQRDAMQRAREELSFRRQAIKDRIGRLDEEIVLLENRIMDMQSQIDSVESFVQRNLEF